MKVLFDIYHLPHINFFKKAIYYIGPEKAILACVDRGKLIDVLKYEFPEYKLYVFGNYRYNKDPLSIIFRIVIPRIFKLIRLIMREKFSLVLTVGYQANIAAGLLSVKNINFTDDPRKFHLKIIRRFANKTFIPSMNINDDKVTEYNAMKEWAYLSPTYFSPQVEELNKFKIQPYKYIFIREVSTKTLNYKGQDEGLVLSVVGKIKGKVLLSLEKKNNAFKYPSDWIILEEPIGDIHTLVYYSKLLISSGDSMAREAAMLGVPSIYLGMRDMSANEKLIKENLLKKVSLANFDEEYNRELKNRRNSDKQELARHNLEKKWTDVSKMLIELIDNQERI